MKIIGNGTFDANVTTTERSLAAALLVKPEISANVVNLFEKNFAAFSSYLARKGLVKKGLFPDFTSPNFKVIGNKQFKWPLKGYPFRKGRISGTVTSPAGYANLGENNSIVLVPLDTNYFSPNDVLELKDRRTHLQLLNEFPKETSSGVWEYKAKLAINNKTGFIAADLVADGSEVGFSHTAFPEMSETGYEKNTYPEWHTNFMTIQRMAYSISGTADATVLWIEHNGQKLWCFEQDMQMMERWAYARENQLIFGRSTIDANNIAYVKDLKNRDIIQGDGLLASGEGSLKMQYNKLSISIIERVMQNLQLLANSDGTVEVLCIAGQKFIWDFQRLMRDVFKYNPMPLFVDGKGGKEIDATFVAYQLGGVRLVTAWNPAFDAAWRPQDTDVFGVSKESYRAIFVSLGNTVGANPNVELVALGGENRDRSFVKKVINGMASPGEQSSSGRMQYASNSMDGFQCQILSETGIKLGNPYGVAELYKP